MFWLSGVPRTTPVCGLPFDGRESCDARSYPNLQEAGSKGATFESDSVQLIKCINSETVIAEILSVVADILSLSVVFDFVSFSWIPREKNSVTDLLENNSLLVGEPVVVEEGFNAPL
ncbi:hypothetical protein Bca4012_058633 [Brassica carinata]